MADFAKKKIHLLEPPTTHTIYSDLVEISHTAEQRLVEVIGTREILRHTNGSSKPRESQCITFKMNVDIQRTKLVFVV